MMNLPESLEALVGSLKSLLPSLSTRRGLSQTVIAGVIVAIIIVGGVAVYIVATSFGVTTTQYP